MKQLFLCIITLLTGISAISAQNEVPADTIRSRSTERSVPEGVSPGGNPLPADVKNFDGFLLDMGLMNMATPPTLPRFTLQIPDASKDYGRIFQLNPNVTYSQGLSNMFSLSNSQMRSFTLKNGMRINTYGEYNKDGYKVHNPSALPWQKNNFKGAFEMKSANGSFGIRIEVQQGRQNPF